MDKEKINEIQTLADGINYDLQELKKLEININWKLRQIEKIISDKKEEF